jgi:signal transduction histidine kinase
MNIKPDDNFEDEDLFAAEDDEDLFATEDDKDLFTTEKKFTTKKNNTSKSSSIDIWKILVVDDDADVLQMTKVVLTDFTFKNKRLEILNANSALTAKQVLGQHSDIAIIFLDVVMETSNAGLKVVEYIRKTLQNRFIRIVLRTGQPGYAPEKEVIRKYEINDYANKAELTAQKIFTLVTANLRAYSDIITIESYRQHLEEKVAARTDELNEKNLQLAGLNHKLTKLNEDLLRLNREKDEFLSIVAHDLKNPLSAIKGYTEEIQEYFAEMPEDEVIELVDRIHLNSHQMFELIKLLLDVSVIESGRINISLKTVNVLPILQLLVNDYTVLAKKKNIIVQFQVSAKQYLAFVDENTFRQILDNLISNAVKYSPHGKNVTVRLSQNDQEVRCEVQDEGPGLSYEDKQKLFGKFSRLTAKPTGGENSTGLGLFIVKKLVNAMNGMVWCESEIGIGATFIAEFPKGIAG